MKKLNKAIAIALSAVTVFSASSVVPITASAKVTNVVTSSATSNKSGKWGSNAKWSYNSKTKTLTITGKGTLKNVDVKLPINTDHIKIDHIVVKEGITVLENDVLNWLWPKDITLPTSIRSIGFHAFATEYMDIDEPMHDKGITIYGEYGSVTEEYCKNGEADEYYFFRGYFEPINKSKNRTSGICGADNVKWKLDKNGKMTITGKGLMYGKPSTKVFDKRKVKEVVVGNGVKDIYKGCFRDYPNLKKVTLPDSITNTEPKVFYGCKNLQTVVLPKKLKTMDNYLFANCSNLKTIKMPTTVGNLGNGVFQNCSSLKTVKMPTTVAKLGNYVFQNCSSLTSVSLPNTITKMGYSIFSGCTSLTSANIPNKLVAISGETFLNCKNLTNVTVPESVNKINYNAFENCSKLKNVDFLKNITSFGEDAFKGCSSIEKITLNDNAKIVCDKEYFPSATFLECSNLKEINISENNKYYTLIDGVLYTKDKKTLILYPSGNEAETVEIPNFVTKVGRSSFQGSKNIKKLVIPGNVTNVSEKAFANCSNLETVTLPDNFKEISDYAFSGCSKLKSINFPTTLKEFGYNAFCNCVSLSEFSLNDGLKRISIGAFKGCKSLTSITIPNSVTNVRENAFQNCTKLKNVKLSDNTDSIYYYAFSNCVSLTDITIPSNVTYVDTYAFVNCKSLSKFNVSKDNKTFSSVRGMLYNKNGDKLILFPMNKATSYSLPKGTKTIGKSAFENGKIKKITLPNTLKKIDGAAFLNCKDLYSINIPSSVTEINANILRGTKYYKTSKNWYKDQLYVSNCVVAAKKNIKAVSLKSSTRLIAKFAYDSNKVTTVKLPNGIKYINTSAFYYCDKLKKITLPKSLVSIGDGAFAYGVTFYVYKNSVGYEYAKNSYNKYKIIK